MTGVVFLAVCMCSSEGTKSKFTDSRWQIMRMCIGVCIKACCFSWPCCPRGLRKASYKKYFRYRWFSLARLALRVNKWIESPVQATQFQQIIAQDVVSNAEHVHMVTLRKLVAFHILDDLTLVGSRETEMNANYDRGQQTAQKEGTTAANKGNERMLERKLVQSLAPRALQRAVSESMDNNEEHDDEEEEEEKECDDPVRLSGSFSVPPPRQSIVRSLFNHSTPFFGGDDPPEDPDRSQNARQVPKELASCFDHPFVSIPIDTTSSADDDGGPAQHSGEGAIMRSPNHATELDHAFVPGVDNDDDDDDGDGDDDDADTAGARRMRTHVRERVRGARGGKYRAASSRSGEHAGAPPQPDVDKRDTEALSSVFEHAVALGEGGQTQPDAQAYGAEELSMHSAAWRPPFTQLGRQLRVDIFTHHGVDIWDPRQAVRRRLLYHLYTEWSHDTLPEPTRLAFSRMLRDPTTDLLWYSEFVRTRDAERTLSDYLPTPRTGGSGWNARVVLSCISRP